MEVLELPSNQISEIKSDDFQGLFHLNHLDLSSNVIENIDDKQL